MRQIGLPGQVIQRGGRDPTKLVQTTGPLTIMVLAPEELQTTLEITVVDEVIIGLALLPIRQMPATPFDWRQLRHFFPGFQHQVTSIRTPAPATRRVWQSISPDCLPALVRLILRPVGCEQAESGQRVEQGFGDERCRQDIFLIFAAVSAAFRAMSVAPGRS